jgi:hypothetical protein
MRWKVVFISGAIVGYVLGAKAGRERYEQIVRIACKIGQSPTLQGAVGVVQEQTGKLINTGKDAAGSTFRRSAPE